MTFVGACEVAGAIGLLIRPLSMWAAIGLAIIMIGAALRCSSPGPLPWQGDALLP